MTKLKIRKQEYYYSEDEVQVIVGRPGKEEEEIFIPLRIVKGTLNMLRDKKVELKKQLDEIDKEIDINKEWLDLAVAEIKSKKIKYLPKE